MTDQKAFDRRRGALFEMERVLVGAVERLAGFVAEIERVDRILGQVRAEAELRNDGALEVVIAVDAHRVGVHRPVVRDAGKRRNLPLHQLLRRLRAPLRAPSSPPARAFSISKLLPGSMPMRFICAMIGSSVMCGGFTLSSSAA